MSEQLDLLEFPRPEKASSDEDFLGNFVSKLRKRMSLTRARELFCVMFLLEWADEYHSPARVAVRARGAYFLHMLASHLNPATWYSPGRRTGVTDGLMTLSNALASAASADSSRYVVYLETLARAIGRVGVMKEKGDVEYIAYLLSPLEQNNRTADRLLRLFDRVSAMLSDKEPWRFAPPPWLCTLLRDLGGPDSPVQTADPTVSSEHFLTLIAEYVASVALGGSNSYRALPYDPRLNEHEFLLGITRLVLSEHAELNSDAALVRKFDAVLTNPPFGRTIERELRRRGDDMADVTDPESFFVESILEQLAPEGHTAITVPAGFLFRESALPLRRRLIEGGHLEAVISLPRGSFGGAPNLAAAILVLGGRDSALAQMRPQATVVQLIDGSSLGPLRASSSRRRSDSSTGPVISVEWTTGPPPTLHLLYSPLAGEGRPGLALPCDSWLIGEKELEANGWTLRVERRENHTLSWLNTELGEALEREGAIAPLEKCTNNRVGL
jgi:hypothetical protein